MKTAKFFLLILSMSICSTFLNAQTTRPAVDGVWKIKSYKDAGKMVDAGTKETEITINTKGKTIHAYVGCNRLSANFEFITADKVKAFQLVSTRKACKGDEEVIENALRYVMEQTNSVRKNGAKVEFYKENELLLVLERIVDTGKKKKK